MIGDLNHPDLYINRELSLLAFNERVLAQSEDEANPLLERLKFLCISCTNLDEFFEVRVAAVKQRVALGSVHAGPDNLSPSETLAVVGPAAQALVARQYEVLNETMLPALAAEGIRFIRRWDWTPEQETWLREYFEQNLLPVLTPMSMDPAHPFPRILNKSLNFIVTLEGLDAFGRKGTMAVVQAPRSLPRIIQLPQDETGSGPYAFVFLSSVIHAFVVDLFPGVAVTGCYQFRITRNSDLFLDQEEVDDLLRAVEGELPGRRYGEGVRLEVVDNCPEATSHFLLSQFKLGPDDLYRVNGPVNLNRLIEVIELVDRPDLKFPAFTPGIPKALAGRSGLFSVLRKQDVLLHHPFESFKPVIDFLRLAAVDPQVLAIKQTLYRTGPQSAVVDALVKAAKNGKEVTVVIELMARFDEETNIRLATRLQEAGAHVVYGVFGYKCHAKMCLVVRREGKKLRNYMHLGTGNYHARTARLYTDYGLLTADKQLGQDVNAVFLLLTSASKVRPLRKALHAPFDLHRALIEQIENEVENARKGQPARVIAKVNSLVEPSIIRACYEASQHGVKIDLIVRGMCRLRPGVPGVSDNIRVRSIVGRFLEHTRVFYFLNGDDPLAYCSSADWMDRNFFRRVETAFPIEDPAIRERVIDELETYLKDDAQAWELGADGEYRRVKPNGGIGAAQQVLMERLGGTA
ncbi:MAG: polyphosphate kinase 1 [Leptospirillia bacterium]